MRSVNGIPVNPTSALSPGGPEVLGREIVGTIPNASLPGASEVEIFMSPTGSDSNSGSSISPVLTLDRALALMPPTWSRGMTIAPALGGTALDAINRPIPNVYTLSASNIFVGVPDGPQATPLLILGGFMNELGTRSVSAGTTINDVIDSTLGSTIRSGTGTFVAGAPAGKIRLQANAGTPFVATDTGRMFMIRLGASPGNNSTSRAAFVDATHIDLTNPQGVVADANNGNIYWQESFEGGTLSFSTGTAAGQRRSIRDHGVEATGTITTVPVVNMVDNDYVFVPDGVGAGMNFEFKVTGGFVAAAPLPRTTVDISALSDTTANGVAVALFNAINATLVSALQVRATTTNQKGNNQVQVKNMMLGITGNVAMVSHVANVGFTVSGFSGGVGMPLTTFRLSAGLTGGVPANGSSFQVEHEAVVIQYNSTIPGGVAWVGESVGWYGIKWQNTGGSSNAFILTGIQSLVMTMGCEWDQQGGSFVDKTGALETGVFIGGANWLGAAINPFTAAQDTCGNFWHDGGFTVQQARCAIDSCMRNESISVQPGSVFVAQNPDWKRTTLTARQGSTVRTTSAGGGLPGRMDGQNIVSASTGILNLPGDASFVSIASVDISNSGGDGIQLTAGSYPVFASPLTGLGNAGVGIRVSGRSLGIVPTSGMTITGAAGDMVVGTHPSRSWSDFNTNPPLQREFDVSGDGSCLQTAASTAIAQQLVVYTPLALGNFAVGGSIGTAATTVDIASEIGIAQTTAAQTLTIPNPTQNSPKKLSLLNNGSTSFTIGGTGAGSVQRTPPAGTAVEFTWSPVSSLWCPHSLA